LENPITIASSVVGEPKTHKRHTRISYVCLANQVFNQSRGRWEG